MVDISEIDDRFWEAYFAMSEGVCLHEIIFDDAGLAVDYKILRCNPSYEKILGLKRDRAMGSNASELYGTGQAPYLDIYAEVASSGEPVEFETYFAPMRKYFHISAFSLETGRFFTVFSDISERKLAEKALRESEARFRSLVETSSDWIWETDKNGAYTYASPKCKDLLGYAPEEIIGMTPFDFMPPGEAERIGEIFNSFVREQKPMVHLENVNLHKDGTRVMLETSGVPIFDAQGNLAGYRGVDRDISDRVRVENELQKLALAVKHSDELVNMGTMEGMMTFINDAGARMLGIDQDQVEKTHIMEVIPEHLTDLVTNELLPALMRGDTWEGELQYKNLKTGELTDVHAMTYTVPDPATGRPLFLANVSMDITERKQAERERRALEDQVQHMQKLESLGVLAGGIAHDFNNLLVGIMGNADLALDKLPKNSPIRTNLDDIGQAAVRAADLCRQMLAYSGKGKFVVEVLDLREVVEEMAQMLEVSISKKASLSYKFMDNVPSVEADSTQLRQILLNLITNASEALGDKSGAISLTIDVMECDREYLSGAFIDEELPPGTYVSLEVADTGQGMDEQTLPKIFDPFFTTKFTGRGLGLSAVLGIIRGHKGAIKVYSEPGKGTSFKVLLPAAKRERVQKLEQRTSSDDWQGSGTILLIDDEEIIRTVGREMLIDFGFDVLTASDGREALEVFKSHKDEIVLVILDLTMPVMDGEETFREMRRIKEGVPVILCSGYNEQDVTQRFVGRGLAGFIQKPFKMEVLFSKLRQLLL